MEQIKKNAAKAQEEANKAVLNKAADLVKKAIVKTIELEPDKIDEALIKKAIFHIKQDEI